MTNAKISQIDFDLLLSYSIHKPKEFVYSHPEYRLSVWQRLRLKYFLFLRKRGYSVAAITGHKEFYGLDFFENKNVLTPRPDTELMVAEAIRIMNYELRIKNDQTILIDVGTGSGCIPIAIIKTLAHKNINTFATDISGAALRVAKKNARKHNVDIKFFKGNLLTPIKKIINHKSKIINFIITANLPYLTEKQFQSEPSIQREPKNALVAANNGLALYEELFKQIKNAGLTAIIFLEIDPSQSETIVKIIKRYFPNSNVEIKKDLGGLDRLVKIF